MQVCIQSTNNEVNTSKRKELIYPTRNGCLSDKINYNLRIFPPLMSDSKLIALSIFFAFCSCYCHYCLIRIEFYHRPVWIFLVNLNLYFIGMGVGFSAPHAGNSVVQRTVAAAASLFRLGCNLTEWLPKNTLVETL